MLHLLRVNVPDRPGSLGAVATAIGNAGGDIAAVDVVERGPMVAVDDILVDLDADAFERLPPALEELPGVVVESLEPFSDGDQLADGLDVLDRLATSSGRALAAIVRMAPRIVRARWVVVLTVTGRSAVVDQASSGAPRARWASLPWLPLDAAAALDPDPAWVPHAWGEAPEMAAAPIGDPAVLLAIRPRGPRFRAAEVTKLAHLAELAGLAAHDDDAPERRTARSPAR
jgi:hypothetical protein